MQVGTGMMTTETQAEDRRGAEELAEGLARSMEGLREQLGRVLVGQEETVSQLIVTLLAGGHALLTGVPGLGKTLLVKSLARLLSLSFSRIQFTPDLMPADIVGTEVMQSDEAGNRSFRFVPGPVFAGLVLADEVNRTPPRTQAALLEAMGEGHVTAGGRTYPLERPFFVLATQNPLELEGTYPLPEAQLDRFMLNVVLDYLPLADEVRMVRETTTATQAELTPVLSGEELLAYQRLVRQVPVSGAVAEFAVRLCASTRPGTPLSGARVTELVKWGAGPRASQALVLAGKARALLSGRLAVSEEDIRALALPVLRHRVIMNYRAEAEGVDATGLLTGLLAAAPSC